MKYLLCLSFIVAALTLSVYAAEVADFDGDGRTDLSVFRPSEGMWYVDGGSRGFQATQWGHVIDTVTPGDFDGDGKTDWAVYRAMASLPFFCVLRSSDFTARFFYFGLPTDTSVIGDYDGDLRSDFAVYRQSNNTWYIAKSSDGQFLTFRNVSGGRPATGDFDGDGKTDIANYPGSEWFILRSSTNYTLMVLLTIGGAQDRTAAADYDGDGKTDAAIYNPTTGTWVIRYSSNGTTANIRWGISTDRAVPGDYDGDGLADVAIYRDGTWWLLQSRDGIVSRQFGLSGDIPIPNRYLP